MKSITLKGTERESVGKVSTKALRNAGLVPCVIYGGENPVHFAVEAKALVPLVYTPDAHTVDIELEGGKKFNAAMQDLQFHPVSDEILHVDFIQLFKDKPVTMIVPVKYVGNSAGVRAGGNLAVNARKIPVRALVADLPDNIEIDITNIELGDKFSVAALPAAKYKVIAPENQVLAYIKVSRNAAKAAQEAAQEDDKKKK